MIVDPWGTVLAEAPNRECCIVAAEIDLEAQQEIRSRACRAWPIAGRRSTSQERPE